MLEKEKIRSYQGIKAPSELRERVLSLSGSSDVTEKSSNRFYYKASLIAACFVLIFAIIIQQMGNNKSISVFMDGVEITNKSIQLASSESEIALAREINPLTVTLNLYLEQETEVKVSSGAIITANKPQTDKLVLGGVCEIEWLIFPFSEDEQYTMKLINSRQNVTLSLRYDSTADKWVISGK